MIFELSKSDLRQGEIVYVSADRAFQTRPVPDFSGSIQINEIEILLNAEGTVVGISGYCPPDAWENAHLDFPPINPGAVRCRDGVDPNGIPIRYGCGGRWRIFHDSEKEILCIGERSPSPLTGTVEVLRGLAFGFEHGHLKQIWIRLPSHQLGVG